MAPKAAPKSALDAKLEAFRQRVKRENIVEPNMNLVKENFSPSEMRQADISIKDAWKDLTGTEDGKTQSKELKGMCNLVKDYALVQLADKDKSCSSMARSRLKNC